MLKPDFAEPVSDGARRRMKKRRPLTTHDRVSIVHQVLVNHEKHADVAKAYRVSPQVVASLILRVRRKPEVLREIMASDAERDAERQHIKNVV